MYICLNEIVVKSRYTFETVTTWVQKFAIVAKLSFFNLLYYSEVTYPFSNKGIHLLSTLIFKDDSLKMLTNGV